MSNKVEIAPGDLREEFLSEQSTHNSEGTVRVKRKDLKHLSEWIATRDDMADLLDMTPRAFRRYITESINDGAAPTTTHNRYNSATTFYQWLADVGESVPVNDEGESTLAKRIGKGQFKAMRKRSKKERSGADFYLDAEGPESVETLVENVPAPKLRNQLIVRLMFSCGFRAGEVASITLDHFDVDSRSVTVRNLKAGDNQDLHRTNWFGGKVEPLARAWLRTGRPDVFESDESEYLFPTTHGERINPQIVTRIVKRAAENAGIQEVLYTDSAGNNRHKITAHTLRHSYGVYCIREGMDVKTLKDLMGHESLETTMGYLKYRDEELRDSARKYNP